MEILVAANTDLLHFLTGDIRAICVEIPQDHYVLENKNQKWYFSTRLIGVGIQRNQPKELYVVLNLVLMCSMDSLKFTFQLKH